MRQALAGMLWTKQYYGVDVDKWLAQHEARPLVPHSRNVRNKAWFHMVNGAHLRFFRARNAVTICARFN